MAIPLVPVSELTGKTKKKYIQNIEKDKIEKTETEKKEKIVTPIVTGGITSDKEKDKDKIIKHPSILKAEEVIENKEDISKDIENKKDEKETKRKEQPVNITKPDPNMLVKKVYFPGNIYSNNQKEFKKIIAEFGFKWVKAMMKTYVNKDGIKLLTGMYSTDSADKKLFMIYEGSDKPVTMLVKIIGSGGNFLLKIIEFCHRIGCIIEDKDEFFINNIILRLQDYGDINVVEKKSYEQMTINEKKTFEDRIEEYITKDIDEYVKNHIYLTETRGVKIDTIKYFRRKDIERDFRWAMANGFIRL